MLCIRLLLKVRIVGLRVAAAGGVSGWMKEGEERERVRFTRSNRNYVAHCVLSLCDVRARGLRF